MKNWMTTRCNANLEMIAKHYNISEIMAEILVKRGLHTWDAMDKYLFPDIEAMYKPELMKDLVKAADIIESMIKQKKKMLIIGDYDVDGIMSSYILIKGISMLGGEASYRIPHRVRDGYGIRDYMVEEAYADGVECIITCDNGISAIEAAEKAGELGITYVLTDHHEVPSGDDGEIIPIADAVVNPKQKACQYPYKMLCGAGVAYKILSYIFEKNGDLLYRKELLPFAAIATVCDVVPLEDENRIIVSNGLKMLADKSVCISKGLRALINAQSIERELNSYDLGFRIGPCLNAAGRLDDAARGLELMLEEDDAEAQKEAAGLVALNDERKELTALATENAVQQIESTDALSYPVLVIYIEGCHESVAGIVAGRIREKYYRPTYILTDGEQGLKGSGRSIPGYHMQQALTKCQDLLTEYGGHALAAGFSLPKENLEIFRKTLNEQCTLTEDELIESVFFDKELPFGEVSAELVGQLKWMEPFGEGNRGTLFAKRGIVVRAVYMCGKENQIARLRLQDGEKIYDAVDFNAENCIGKAITERYGSEEWKDMKNGKTGQNIDVLYIPDINDRYGSVQFKIVDCR